MFYEMSKGPMGQYFMFHQQDKIPIYTGFIIITFYLLFTITLNWLLKKKAIDTKKIKFINLSINLVFVITFFIVMEFVSIYSINLINSENIQSNTGIDLLLIWKMRENIRHRESGVGYFSTNSEGIRSEREIPYKKEKNEFRILVLGDSWVFGLNVDDKQTFCHILEQKLSAKYTDKKITVINGGCPGYCLAQGYLFLLYRGIKYKPDLIIVKNFANETGLKAFSVICPAKKSCFATNLKSLFWNSNLYLYLRRIIFINNLHKREVSKKKWNKQRGGEESAYNQWLLEEIDSCCKKKKIPVLYLNLELNGRLYYNWSMTDFAKEKKSKYLEISLDPDKDKEFNKIDPTHPGPENHKVIAESIYDFLVKTSVAF